MKLNEYIERQRSTPFGWGTNDCCTLLNEYIESQRNASFGWGTNDCYTFVRGWIDLQFPQNKLPVHTYKDFKGACRWNYERRWVEELKKAFSLEIVDSQNVRDGDILVIEDAFQCAHLINNHTAYNIDVELGLVGISLKLFPRCSFIRLERAY